MKEPFKMKLFCVLALLFVFGEKPGLQAQEENLKMALEMQDRRIEGLTALAEKIKGFGFLGSGTKVVKKLEDRERKEDPFGMSMDPEEELPDLVPEQSEVDAESEEMMRTSLQEALQKFQPTGFNPSKGEIIVGAQNLRAGDSVLIDYKGVSFNLTIQEVKGKEIVVKDLDTGEVASKQMGFDKQLPAGMTRRQPEASAEDKARQASTIVPFSERAVKVR